MGDIYRISCPACNSLWELHTGNGLIHGRKEKVVSEFPKELRAKAEAEYADGSMPFFSFRTALCDKCRSFYAVPVLSDNISGKIYVTGFCPECGDRSISIKDRPEQEACPSCGKSGLTVSRSGSWD